MNPTSTLAALLRRRLAVGSLQWLVSGYTNGPTNEHAASHTTGDASVTVISLHTLRVHSVKWSILQGMLRRGEVLLLDR